MNDIDFKELFKRVFALVKDAEHLKSYQNAQFDFDVMYCDNKTIQEINRDYRKKDAPTDVITFALFFDCEQKIVQDGTINLGEIIISEETARAQAKESYEKEICTLLTHGILHLLGFDHQTQEDYDFVISVQNNICSSDFCSNL